MDGCLEYGNQSQFIEPSFLADEEDEKGVDHEKKVGCRQAAAEFVHAAGERIRVQESLINITQAVTNYFPSIAKHAEQTMLHLAGQAGVVVGDGKYTSYFKYTLSPLENSKGDPNVVTVAPAFVGPAEVLLKNYYAQNPPSKISKRENEIRFTVIDIKNPTLVYATYDFLDGEHEIVASVDIPVFVSGGR